jgi:RimJ/RimL family protein N-acetyltransferase
MSGLLEIKTARLLLRPFTLGDAVEVRRLAGDKAVSAGAINIPYPYESGMAEEWIAKHDEWRERGEQLIFAAVRAADGVLVGAVGLIVSQRHRHAELGYWIGRPHWSQGYATEAAAAALRHAFETLRLHRVHAACLTRNPASARVLENIGMTHEGTRRQHLRRLDQFEDIEEYGILRAEYDPRRPAT